MALIERISFLSRKGESMSELSPSSSDEDTKEDSTERLDRPQSICPVELAGEGEPIRVTGRSADGISGVAYRALEALRDAFPDGLTRQQLNEQAGSRDARRALQYLEKVEPWKSAGVFVSDHGVGKRPTVYRLAGYRIVWGWWVSELPQN
jgi:hypothetical protein